MKLILTILSLFSVPVFATNYYITNSGSDANSGTSAGAAWQTIHKVNTYSLSPGFVAGDSILLKRDDTFNDSLRFYSSGSFGNPIVISCYGTGNIPIITGFKTPTMSNIGGNVWFGLAPGSLVNQNTVAINDTLRWKARYPNTTVFTFSSIYYLSYTYLVIPHSATNYTGQEIAINESTWDIFTTKVAHQNNGIANDTLYFTQTLSYSGGNGGNGYFFQNNLAYLDSLNEWVYKNDSLWVYSISAPIVKYSSIDTLVKFHKISNVTFQNINLSGGNYSNISIDTSANITVTNCKIRSCGFTGVISQTNNNSTFTNDSLLYSLNNGFYSGFDTSLIFNNNLVQNSGIYAGMQGHEVLAYAAGIGINVYRDFKYSVTNNQCINSGYAGILFEGGQGLVYQNYVHRFCFIKSDGGGIYTWGPWDSATVVRKNIVFETSDTPVYGVLGYIKVGLYLDAYVNNIIADSNMVYGMPNASFIKGHDNTVNHNIFYPTSNCYGVQFYEKNANQTFKYNTVYIDTFQNVNSVVKLGYNVDHIFTNDTLNSFDYNNYLMRTDTSNLMWDGSTPNRYSLYSYKNVYPSMEIHSTSNFPATNTSKKPTLIYNNSFSDSTYVLGGNYVDQDGNIFYGSVTLKPFTSKLIFTSSSVIHNGFYMGGYKFK